jgi:hypothetical protein
MLHCPACGVAAEGGSSTCATCGSSLLPRVDSRRRKVEGYSPARKAQIWFRAKKARWHPGVWRLGMIAKGMVALVLLAGVAYAVVRFKPKKKPVLTREQAMMAIGANPSFSKPREVWIPRSASVFPDGNWLAMSHPVQSVSSGQMPVEYKQTEAGEFKENYSEVEYEELCPPIMLLVELGLATVSHDSTKYYYIFHEPKIVPRYVKPLGGPGGWVKDVIKMNAVYSLWGHSLDVSLTPAGADESLKWSDLRGKSLYDAKWFPYDSDAPFASGVPQGDRNIRRLYKGGWLVPIADRRLVEISALTVIAKDRAEVEFTWEWSISKTGEAFVAEGQKYKSLTAPMQRFVSSPGVRMGNRTLGLGQGHLALSDGKWEFTDLYLENPN